MSSVAHNHFPQIVWRDEKKHLWNPIHRRALKNRPEERVRLRIIEYLIDGGWSKHRISTEEALTPQKEKGPLRTDIICYTQQFDPFLLIECKAEQVKITEKTAAQIARYNQNISAPYLLMTNGRRDFWYHIKEQNNARLLDKIPSMLPAAKEPRNRALPYWKERGFIGEKAAPPLRPWIEKALSESFGQAAASSIRFLSFKKSPSDVDLNNYYIIHQNDDYRLAIAFTATPFGGSRLIAIMNKNGQNTGVIEINLDLLFDDRTPNTSFYDASGIRNFDLCAHTEWNHNPLPINDLITALNRLVPTLAA